MSQSFWLLVTPSGAGLTARKYISPDSCPPLFSEHNLCLSERHSFVFRRELGRMIQRWWRSADTPSRAFGASPFRPRSMVLYLVGRHPIRPNGAYSSRPGLNETLTFPLSPASMARPSARRRESRGDTKAGAPGSCGVKEEGHGRITTVTWRLNIQGLPAG
jgi:hypothetical protein